MECLLFMRLLRARRVLKTEWTIWVDSQHKHVIDLLLRRVVFSTDSCRMRLRAFCVELLLVYRSCFLSILTGMWTSINFACPTEPTVVPTTASLITLPLSKDARIRARPITGFLWAIFVPNFYPCSCFFIADSHQILRERPRHLCRGGMAGRTKFGFCPFNRLLTVITELDIFCK